MEQLDKALEQARELIEETAITTAVLVPHQGRWESPEGAAAPALYWASAGKMVTATVILQLEAEGKLSLNDLLGKYLPNTPYGEVITIGQLLNHSSGLPTNADPTSELELLFPPGTSWNYSNLGYQRLGQVVAVAGGFSYEEAVKSRIATPLGLSSFSVGEADQLLVVRRDGSADTGSPGAAGNIVATASEMLRFLQAFLSGELLPQMQTAFLTETLLPSIDPRLWFGNGVMVYVLPVTDEQHRYWIGHSGGTPYIQAAVVWSVDAHALAAVSFKGRGSAESVANLLFQALQRDKLR